MFNEQIIRGEQEYSRGDFKHSPMVVFYEFTQSCDRICQSDQYLPLQSGELSTAETYRLLEQLGEFPKRPMVVLSGGDPFRREDVYKIAEYSTYCGLELSVTLSATPLVTMPALRQLRDAGIAHVVVSLDGADEDVHDTYRGLRGSFWRTIEILLSAQAVGLPVQVNTTLTLENYRQIDEMADMLAEQEIDVWSVIFPVALDSSNGTRQENRARLAPVEYEWIFERLWRNFKRQPYAIETVEAPQFRRYVKLKPRLQSEEHGQEWYRQRVRTPGFSSLGGNDGKGMMAIGHTGIITPSPFLPIVCGMFPEQNLVDVYQQARLMQSLRDPQRLEGKCHGCEFRYLCGGSRARAYAVTGNPFAQEPDCDYQPILADAQK